MRRIFLIVSAGILALVVGLGAFYRGVWWSMVLFGPLMLIGIYDILQTRHTIWRNFPLIGRLRGIFEAVSPEIQQYFIERHTDGAPIPRNHRKIVYQRAKNLKSTHPFGTELDLYAPDYEGLRHTNYPAPILDTPPRVWIGGPDCRLRYHASLLNISAMSFGSVSRNAVLAMSHGAQMGSFYLNTGEGGISSHHLEGDGDLVWQIGTGYFGCRTPDGQFDPELFRKAATHPQVKMIELKVSQGAKPGHGGVLPAEKNTPEIASIRHIKPGIAVHSPPGHSTFSDAAGLLKFVRQLRELSGGKPIGFKLCLGREEEFAEICREMKTSGIKPDFITVDGAEGGTGAAPLEFSDSVGMPLLPALKFVDRSLREHGLRGDIRLIASGKVISAYSIIKLLAHGADLCNSARAFMLALGCIQAQRCDTNLCPTGVATQDPQLVRGLVVADKKERVANFHRNTLQVVLELLAACGCRSPDELNPGMLLPARSGPSPTGERRAPATGAH